MFTDGIQIKNKNMLRNYQNLAIDQIEKINGNVMLQMPTGSGKTFTFCELAKRTNISI